MQVKDFTSNKHKTINPQEHKSTIFHHYSLPAFDDSKTVSDEYGSTILSNKFLLQKSAVLFNKLNIKFKRIWNVKNPVPNSICSSEFIPLIVDETVCLQDYLYYFLCSEPLTNNLLGCVSGTSNSQQRIRPEDLLKQEISIPSIEHQRHIVDILGTLDEKIENNERLYQQIEKECALIFNQVMQSDTTERIALSDVADFYGGYSYSGEELVESSDTGLVTIKNFERTGGFKIEGFKPLCVKGKIKESAYCEIGSLLVAHTDLTQNADIIGNPVLVLSSGQYKNLVASMDLVKVVPKSYFSERILYLLLKSADFKGHALGYSAGTTVLHLSKKALQEYQFNCPCKDTVNNLDKQLYPLFERLKIILFENLKLAELKQLYLKKFFG